MQEKKMDVRIRISVQSKKVNAQSQFSSDFFAFLDWMIEIKAWSVSIFIGIEKDVFSIVFVVTIRTSLVIEIFVAQDFLGEVLPSTSIWLQN